MRNQKVISGSQWLELIGKDRLQGFQDAFAKLNSISLVFQDLEGNPLTVWSNQPLLCNAIAAKNGERCALEQKKNLDSIRGREKSIITSCYLGLVHFTIPVCYNHQIVAYCIGGGGIYDQAQFSQTSIQKYHINQISEESLKNIVEVLEKFLNLLNIDLDRFLQQYQYGTADVDPFAGLLSRREKEVALAICNGLTNKEVAKKLFISEKTVKSHVSSILLKLNLNDRVQLVLKYCGFAKKELSDNNEAGK